MEYTIHTSIKTSSKRLNTAHDAVKGKTKLPFSDNKRNKTQKDFIKSDLQKLQEDFSFEDML